MKGKILVAALATAALAAPVAQAGHRDDFVKEPTAVGSGGAAGTVDKLATKAAIDTLERGGNAVDATVAAAGVLGVTEPFSAGIGGGGFMVIRTPQGRVTTIDGREKAPAAMRPDSFLENGAPLLFADARWSGLSAGVPGTVAQWELALDRYGTKSLRKVLQPGDRRRPPRLHRRPDLLRPDHAERRLLRRRPVDGRDLPRPGRHAARRRQHAAQPGPGAHLRVHRAQRGRRLLPRPARARDRRRGIRSAARRRRQPRLAARADDRARPARVRRRLARAHADRLQGPRRLGHGPAVERRLDRRRGAEHPRGPAAVGARPHALAALLPRGLALRVRRPRRLPRRPGLLRRAAALPALGPLRGRAAGADHRDGGHQPGRGGRLPHARSRLDGERGPVDDAPDGRRRPRLRRLLHVHGRVDRRQRHRRARLGPPAQQRADGLRLQLAHGGQPRRRRQAAAQLDGAHDHHPPRAAGAGGRLARRLDDHHHRAAGAPRAARARQVAAGGDRRAARVAAQHGHDDP